MNLMNSICLASLLSLSLLAANCKNNRQNTENDKIPTDKKAANISGKNAANIASTGIIGTWSLCDSTPAIGTKNISSVQSSSVAYTFSNGQTGKITTMNYADKNCQVRHKESDSINFVRSKKLNAVQEKEYRDELPEEIIDFPFTYKTTPMNSSGVGTIDLKIGSLTFFSSYKMSGSIFSMANFCIDSSGSECSVKTGDSASNRSTSFADAITLTKQLN